VPPVVREVLKSQGNPLDSNVRDAMGARMGRDFSGIRVHSGAQAAGAARSLDALAFTVGRDIVFGDRQYEPSSRHGQYLIAHELAHVAQQEGAGGAQMQKQAMLKIGSASDPAESEADRVAEAVTGGKPVPFIASRPSAVRRSLSDGAKVGIGIAIGSAVAIGAGFGIAAALGAFSSKDEVPSLSDPKYRERWEKALQEGLGLLEAKQPEGCAFPESEKHKYDDKNWNETTLFPLQGKAYSAKAGTPHDAVAGLFANLDKWECDCRLFSEIAILYAWYGSLTKDQFNKKFAGFRLTPESTTGLDRQIVGSGLGESAENPEEVSDSDWHNAPVGSKAVWRNTSQAAHVPWEYEHAVKRFKGKNSAEDLYAAQGVGFHVTEEEVKKEIARHSEDFGSHYELDDGVLAKLKADGTSDEVVRDLATIKGQSFKTSEEFLRQPPLRNLQKHHENKPILDKIMKLSLHDPPPDKMEAYIRKYIRRDKVEIPK
jgi:hypothetical protein